MTEWIVVGAGFTGATIAERIARVRGERVTILERRNHIAGNAHDAPDAAGILVHTYGPHIFHTNAPKVSAYLTQFTAWRPYEHRTLGMIDGKTVPIPFNFNSIDALFPAHLADAFRAALLARYREGERVPILKLRQEGGLLGELGAFVYEKVFHNYTLKQWDLTPEQLSPSVTARVPIVVGRDDRYFHDTFQAMPADGYTRLFERMLDHPNIRVELNTEFEPGTPPAAGVRTIYTGPVDAFFGFTFGPLPYRSLRFEPTIVDRQDAQAGAIVNYPDSAVPYTRVTDMKRLTGQACLQSTLVFEYPQPYVRGENEPYYPIPRDENQAVLNRYLDLAKVRDDVTICGRLGDYKYYNMDQAVGAALAIFERLP